MIKKIINKKTLFLLLSLIIPLETSIAYNGSWASNSQILGEDGKPYKPKSPEFNSWKNYKPDGSNKKYRYRYKKIINTSTNISINAYDLNGNSLIPNSTNIKGQFKAGTWVGISLIESKTASWSIPELEYQEIKKKYTCKYKEKGHDKRVTKYMTEENCKTKRNYSFNLVDEVNKKGNCTYTTYDSGGETASWTNGKWYDYNYNYQCPDTHPTKTYFTIFVKKTPEEKEFDIANNSEMRELAVKEVKKEAKDKVGGRISLIEYTRPEDDVKQRDIEVEEKTYVGDESKEVFGNPIEEVQTSKTSGFFLKEYELLQPDICIDVKTSRVTYGDACNNEKELKINNATIYDEKLKKTVKYWHYFIPLKTKSKEEFNIKIIKNENNKFTVDECEDFMSRESEYKNYITIDPEYGELDGKYRIKKRNSDDFKKLKKAKGCYLAITVSFPISQEFYKEVTDKDGNIKLNGFNFYYKPIDINNPFPNGLASTSIWKKWNKDANKKPNLEKSFVNKTYTTTINEKKVREYNKSNPYTSWDNMYKNGVSTFIESQGIVTRTKNANEFYKLACGPYNKNWKGCGNP